MKINEHSEKQDLKALKPRLGQTPTQILEAYRRLKKHKCPDCKRMWVCELKKTKAHTGMEATRCPDCFKTLGLF